MTFTPSMMPVWPLMDLSVTICADTSTNSREGLFVQDTRAKRLIIRKKPIKSSRFNIVLTPPLLGIKKKGPHLEAFSYSFKISSITASTSSPSVLFSPSLKALPHFVLVT